MQQQRDSYAISIVDPLSIIQSRKKEGDLGLRWYPYDVQSIPRHQVMVERFCFCEIDRLYVLKLRAQLYYALPLRPDAITHDY